MMNIDDLKELTTLLDDEECINNSKPNGANLLNPLNRIMEGHSKNENPLVDDLEDLSTLLNDREFDNSTKSLKDEQKNYPVNDSSCGVICKDNKHLGLSDVFKPKSDSISQSEIHTGDTDSSDDEDNKYAANPLYTEYGRSIKNALKKTDSGEQNYPKPAFESSSWKMKKLPSTANTNVMPTATKRGKAPSKDILADPIFGIRVTTPLISSESMKERMAGKIAVRFNRLENHLVNGDKNSDWVFAGVIISKFTRKSQKGNTYACWVMSDLREDLKTVTVFLFGKAYKDLWKTETHTVVAILNSTPLENRPSSKDIAVVSVLNSDQVLIWGRSKDLGVCKARKKNGEPCSSFVNKGDCEFCIYHVKQEYQKFRGRSELQAPSGGGLSQLRNKVLGKNEVFYAGKSFTAVQAKPNKKQVAKDQMRLTQLFAQCESRLPASAPPRPAASTFSARQKLMRDAERLQSLVGAPVTPGTLAVRGLQEEYSKASVDGKNKNGLGLKPEINQSKIKSSNYNEKSLTNKIDLTKLIAKRRKHDQTSANSATNLVNSRVSISKHAETGNETSLNNTSMKKDTDSWKKKGPTKNRFDNIVKLKTCQDEIKKAEVVTCASKQLKPIDMFDVCFDFDDRKDNGCKAGSKTEESKKCLSGPLKEIKSPTKEESMQNISSGRKRDELSQDTRDAKRAICKENSTSPKLSANVIDPTKNKVGGSPPTSNCMGKSGTELNKSNEMSRKANVSPKMKSSTIEHFFKSPVENEPGCGKTDRRHSSDLSSPKILPSQSPSNLPKLTSSKVGAVARQSRAKAKALKYILNKGPIEKEYSAKQKKKQNVDCKNQENKRKRPEENEETAEKPRLSQHFIDLMNATSSHADLVAQAEDNAMEDYFERLEVKEKMEEKMLTTYSVECKAVRCLQCKYKWFTASDLCREQNHPIKVISAVKRFFSCRDCRNRTVSLEVIPLHSCSSCGSGNWQRAPMMRERKSASVHLSIRGGEQRFVNSVESNVNLDLLVPDD